MRLRYRKMLQLLSNLNTQMTPVATNDDIQDWLRRLKDGDQQAAAAIYRGYFGCVKGFVSLHVDDSVAVEEIVDDTFLAAFSNPERFEGRSSFKTWLMSIAKNKSHDWLRRAKREPALSGADDPMDLENLVDQAWPVLDHLAAEQVRAIVRLCLERLSAAHREATYFVFYEEMSVEQAAGQLNCPPGTVKSRLFHARLKMAECLKHRLDGNGVSA